MAGVKLNADWKEIESAGIQKSDHVTLDATNVKLSKLLSLVLALSGASGKNAECPSTVLSTKF